MPRISVSLYSYHRLWQEGASVEELLAHAKDDGAEAVEILDVQLGSRGVATSDLGKFADAVVEQLKDSPLPVASWACTAVFGGPGDAHDTVARMKCARQIAARLGASTVRVFSADEDPLVPDDHAFSEVVRGFREVGPEALALENHGTRFASPEALARFVQAVPGLGLTVDVGNFWLRGFDPVAALATLKTHVRNLHLKDFTDEKTPTALGDGAVPVADAVAQAKDLDVPFTVELEMPEDASAKVRASVEYLRAWLS